VRLTPQQREIIVQTVAEMLGPKAEILLFGLRVDDAARGGDVDLLVRTPDRVDLPVVSAARLAVTLERALGGRRVDVVLVTPDTAPHMTHARFHHTGEQSRCAETEKLMEAARGYFATRQRGLVCAYLFGSVARGTDRAESDVDIAVLYATAPPATLDGLGLDLAGDLEEILRRKVDLVVLNRASPELVHRVLRDGILLCEPDRAARVRFEVRMRAEYFDVLHYLREYRRLPATSRP
jgi:predicted nucleotidyltransferase